MTNLDEARQLADAYKTRQDGFIGVLARAFKELDAENAPWIDEDGTSWERPTAWAYAQVCKARTKWQQRAEAAEAQRDRLMLEFCPDEMTPKQVKNWSEHQRPAAPMASEVEKVATALENLGTALDQYGDPTQDPFLWHAAQMLRQLAREK